MFVKLKDNITLSQFVHLSFGTNGNESIPYYEYFSTDNLLKPTTAKIIDNKLSVDVVDCDGYIIEMDYQTQEAKDIWEVLSR
jgi:hypothetical protein